MASVFEGLEVGPAIEVFALNKAYNEDKSPLKVNLGVGGMFYCLRKINIFIRHFFLVDLSAKSRVLRTDRF